MRKNILISLVVLLLLLIVGCQQKTENVVEKQFVCADGRVVNTAEECTAQNVEVVQEKEIIVDEVKPVEKEEVISSDNKNKEYTFSLEQIRELDKKLVGKRATFITDSMAQPVQVGDRYTFAYGVQNTFIKPMQFKIDIKFLEARTTSNSKIGADELTEKWFGSLDGMNFNLSKNEKKYIPVTVDVWDIASKDSLNTFNGTYTFEIDVYSKDPESQGNFYGEYTSNLFYVRVGK